MNQKKRKELKKALSFIDSASSIIDGVKFDEENCLSNMPDSIQYSEVGERMQDAIDHLEEAEESLRDAIESIHEATN